MSNRIEFYSNPEELPIKRFQRFNKYLMIDVEVGETFADYDQRTHKVVALLRKKMVDDAVRELENRRQAVFNAFEQYSPKHYALALMVKSIDGVDYTDKKYLGEEGLDEILDKLNAIGYTRKELDNDLSEVKKKSSTLWKCITQSISRQTTSKILISFLKNV